MGESRSETALLRRELRRVWALLEILLDLVAGSMGTAAKSLLAMAEEASALREENERLTKEKRGLEERVRMHESWNHAPSEATGYAKDRRRFRREEERHRAVQRGEDPDGAAPGRSPGHQPGAPGVSHHDSPGRNRKKFAARICPQCGRTDLKMLRTIQKLVRNLVEGIPGPVTFLHSIRPGRCPDCGIRVLPHTDAIPGTSFCERLRGTLYELKNERNTVRGAGRLLGKLSGAVLSAGAISNCSSAMAAHIDRSVMEIRSKAVILGHGAHRPFLCPVRPPPEAPPSRYDYDSLLARYGTVWTMSRPLPAMVQILETATMDPWSGTDETGQKVGKTSVQVLVHETRRTAMISVAENRRRKTLYFHASGLAFRPSLHDGNTGNMKLRWWQPPGRRLDARDRALVKLGLDTEVHQFDWIHPIRNVEAVAMGPGLGTPEHAALEMLRGVYKAAKAAGAGVAERAGGEIRSACEIDRVSRMPGVLEYADARVAELRGALQRIASGCGNAKIATIISNAAPYLLTFIKYSGMPPHTNGIEQTIRRRVAVIRKANGPFPNWKAAQNYSVLQTFSATCEKNGISAYGATLAMAGDPDWGVFTAGIPPPILKGTIAA